MSDDLTERLRNHAAFERDNPRRAMSGISAHDWDQAADRIDKLETKDQTVSDWMKSTSFIDAGYSLLAFLNSRGHR